MRSGGVVSAKASEVSSQVKRDGNHADVCVCVGGGLFVCSQLT
jgi:hypothetical protein